MRGEFGIRTSGILFRVWSRELLRDRTYGLLRFHAINSYLVCGFSFKNQTICQYAKYAEASNLTLCFLTQFTRMLTLDISKVKTLQLMSILHKRFKQQRGRKSLYSNQFYFHILTSNCYKFITVTTYSEKNTHVYFK
jgi:hypothetical protein